jgi:hypothetical protein
MRSSLKSKARRRESPVFGWIDPKEWAAPGRVCDIDPVGDPFPS